MLKTLRQIASVGIVSEPPPQADDSLAPSRRPAGSHSCRARPGAVHPPHRRGLLQRLRARDPRPQQPALQPRRAWASGSSRAPGTPTCCWSPARSRNTWRWRCAERMTPRRIPSSWSPSVTAAAPAASSARATRAAGASRTSSRSTSPCRAARRARPESSRAFWRPSHAHRARKASRRPARTILRCPLDKTDVSSSPCFAPSNWASALQWCRSQAGPGCVPPARLWRLPP